MKRESTITKEPDALSGIYDELLRDMNEALSWAKGKVTPSNTTRATFEADPATVTLKPGIIDNSAVSTK